MSRLAKRRRSPRVLHAVLAGADSISTQRERAASFLAMSRLAASAAPFSVRGPAYRNRDNVTGRVQRNGRCRVSLPFAEDNHVAREREGELWQLFVFASVTDPPRYEQTGFYRFLKNELRYEVLLFELGRKTVKCHQCKNVWSTRVEKGVDVALATRMLTLANNRAFDTAILVAADRDYLDTVRAVKGNGLRVEIVAWRGTISAAMEAESSRPVVYLNDIRAEIGSTTPPDEEAERLTEGDPIDWPAGDLPPQGNEGS